ncbi:MAG: PASTA domain-containing protein [Treponema sp.]|nr:PASTA domain-containing protein [Treponema sp.]
MSDETIETEKNEGTFDSEVRNESTLENETIVEETSAAETSVAEKAVKPKKKGGFGTAFSDLIQNFGKGGWVLFVTMLLSFLIMVAVCLVVFFYSVHGEEKVMVPNVVGKSLTNALFDMQVKELYPKIALRYSDLPGDEGTILEQQPAGGSIVKAYRTIDLVVSRGVELETMPDYVGKGIDDVQLQLKTQFSDDPTIEFAPVIYQKNSAAVGTILAQYPEPGTYLSHLKVFFIVSSGNDDIKTIVPDLKNMSVQQVLAQMEKYPILFDFTAVKSDSSETPATVTSQEKVGESVSEFSRVKVQITLPADNPDELTAYGVFTHTLPEYPFPVNVRLECSDSDGSITKIADLLHPGKELTIPYMVKKGSVLTLAVNGETVTSQVIQ